MNRINVNTDIYSYYPSAADECKIALMLLGFNHAHIDRKPGAHGADLWVSDDDREKFETEILKNAVIGSFREFYFSKNSRPSLSYYVSYRKIH